MLQPSTRRDWHRELHQRWGEGQKYHINLGVRTAPLDTAGPQLVHRTAAAADDFPAWAPSGDEIAFSGVNTSFSAYSQIYSRELDGSLLTRMVAPPQSFNQFAPDWSPRGDYVAFTQDSGNAQSDIWTMVIGSSSGAQRLTFRRGFSVHPAFQPNGQRIAYYHLSSDSLLSTFEIRVVNLDGSGDTRLGYIGTSFLPSPLRWSPSGNWLFYSVSDTLYQFATNGSGTRVVRFDLLGTKASSFDLPLGGAGIVMENPHSQTVACGVNLSTAFRRLAIRDTVTQDVKPRLHQSSTGYWSPRWSPNNLRVAYASDRNGDKDVYAATVSFDHAPIFSGLADVGFAACAPYELYLSSSDSDGDAITYQAADLPSGATFSSNRFRWQYPQVGEYYVVFRALDPSGGVANKVVKMTVWDDGSCVEGLMGGGGGGGGGNSLRGNTGRLSLQHQAGPYPAENSLFDGLAVGDTAIDVLKLDGEPEAITCGAGIRLRHGTMAGIAIDKVDLFGVDHGPEELAWANENRVVVGKRSKAGMITTRDDRDVTHALSGDEDGEVFEEGSVLTVVFTQPINHLLVRAGAAPAGAQGGISIQRLGEGGWTTFHRLHPHRRVSEQLVSVDGLALIRMAIHSEVAIEFVGSVRKTDAEPQIAAGTLVALDDPMLEVEDLASSSGGSFEVDGPDTLQLSYEVAGIGAGLQRTWFLAVAGTRTSDERAGEFARREISGMPRVFALAPGYPNPVSDRLRIGFDVPRRSEVRIDVFDPHGRRVATIANGVFDPGNHAVEWNRHVASGSLAKPGVYLYRMTAGDFKAQRKVVVLR